MNEEEYIQQRLDDQQAWYERKSASNQSWYKRLRIVEVVLAAGIPFVSSLIGKFPESPELIPVVVSLMAFLIAASSALLALYRFQDNWLQYRTAAEQLKREKFLYLTKCAPYDGGDAFRLLVANIERILGEENSTWRQQAQSAAAETTRSAQEQVSADQA